MTASADQPSRAIHAIHAYGEEGVLVDVAPGTALFIADVLRTRFAHELRDVVPTADCVLAVFRSRVDVTHVREELAAITTTSRTSIEQLAVTIPVIYNGQDLEKVSRACNLAVSDVIALHSAAHYIVEFFGFAPGFAYLHGLPEQLQLPRRPTPRTEVPAGAVAIAAHYCAVYPRRSPGGWHIIGSTDAVLFDAQRQEPSVLQPGTPVRFQPILGRD